MPAAKKKDKKTKSQPWRENIEALVMAVAVAILFKYFILEISKIPSGSMQPTLMGSPTTGIYDRIVVDKLSMRFRDPERFEIVVFKHPLEQSRIMVKRLVGMPGEDFRIEYGDLWTRAHADEPWNILRRPESIMEGAWRRLDFEDVPSNSSSWQASRDTRDWRISGRSILARGPGSAGFRTTQGSVRDLYTDGYHDSVRAEISNEHGSSGRHPVGDLRLSGEVSAQAGAERIDLTLKEGMLRYVFSLPVAGAAGDSKPSISVLGPGRSDSQTYTAAEDFALEVDQSTRFCVENLDDHLALRVEGELLLELDVQPVANQAGSVELAVEGKGAAFEDLQVYRDVYYYYPDRDNPRNVAGDPWVVTIPEGNYLMLGDNTQDSADSRDWNFKSYTWTQDGKSLERKGNYRAGFNQPNPRTALVGGLPGKSFRDEFGELHWFAEDAISDEFPRRGNLPEDPSPAPLVPRELIIGRALSVFWPLIPSRSMWRFGWLH